MTRSRVKAICHFHFSNLIRKFWLCGSCRVREIEDELVAAIFTCQEGRRDLSLTKEQFTSKSLGILANYRKREAATSLLKSLRTIHTLVSSDIESKCFGSW